MPGAAYARRMPGSIRVARILGIDIRIHISWLLIFFIVTLSLADQVFPFSYPTWSQQKTFIVAAITALLFFLSVVLHELAHALVARRFRMTVSSITLFILGGVASLTKEPPSARAEFFMAAAGPATSIVIGLVSLLISQVVTDNLRTYPGLQPVEAVTGYLGMVNVLVAAFNLVPGFPLDGGRILRSIVWGLRHDRVSATRVAARGGQIVAGLMVVWAGYRVVSGETAGGLWLGLIAYFLYSAASQTLQQERVVAAVGGVRVRQLMATDFRAAPAGASIAQLVRDVLLPHNLRAVPVTIGDRMVGVVTIGDLRKVEQDQWSTTTVDTVMSRADDLGSVSPDDALMTALERFADNDLPLLPVLERGSLVGVLYREALMGYVRMREMLGFDPRR
jgi:Zn-dependent protease/CBS domain-containing protein